MLVVENLLLGIDPNRRELNENIGGPLGANANHSSTGERSIQQIAELTGGCSNRIDFMAARPSDSAL